MKKSISAGFRSQHYQFMSLGACLLLFLFVSCSKENVGELLDSSSEIQGISKPASPTLDIDTKCNCEIYIDNYQGTTGWWGFAEGSNFFQPSGWRMFGENQTWKDNQGVSFPLPSPSYPLVTNSGGYATITFTGLEQGVNKFYSFTYGIKCNGIEKYKHTISFHGTDAFTTSKTYSIYAECNMTTKQKAIPHEEG